MNDAADVETKAGLAPWSLKDAPSFIERQFPVGRLSAEAYKERKAGAGQTLTALGSYWKGRKPLILVRAVVLGCLLPATDDPVADLDIFLKLMAMDDAAFGRRYDGGPTAFARLFPDHARTVVRNRVRVWRSDISVEEFKRRVADWCATIDQNDITTKYIYDDLTTFQKNAKAIKPSSSAVAFASVFPEAADDLTNEMETAWRWRDDVDEDERAHRISIAFATMPYAERVKVKDMRRPEECDAAELLGPIWLAVNGHLGTSTYNLPDLIEQLGLARFGRRPKLADTFCGGGSIPFEAARLGCNVYASDLNPIACMLTWGAVNIIGASDSKRTEIDHAQRDVAAEVEAEIARLGIEYDSTGNRAKVFLYCLETRCPKTGWLVPMAPSWIISKTRNVVAKLIPDNTNKRYDIEVHSGVSAQDMAVADKGTVREGRLIHPMNPDQSGVEIRTIRGDYRDDNGVTRNRLRVWGKEDFVPKHDDIFQERLFCIHWVTKASIGKGRQDAFFAAVTQQDRDREDLVESIVRKNLAAWQLAGIVPDMAIEPGEKTDELIRTRGWRYWHHLFGARQILMLGFLLKKIEEKNLGELAPGFCAALDNAAKLCSWNPGHPGSGEYAAHVFYNMAFNTFLNYAQRSVGHICNTIFHYDKFSECYGNLTVTSHPASEIMENQDIYITDPPYADAINYSEITEFFIAWLRKRPPAPFDQWVWTSGREHAIKGKDERFRRDMVAAYGAMTRYLSDSGQQVVLFTHQDASVWADLGSILWAAGLCVSAAWNIVTETEKPAATGNYVQGTICLVLRKRLGNANARRMEIEAEIEDAVRLQMDRLNALEDAWHERSNAETIYTDGDLTLAAYAAALQVVTAYSSIDRQPLDRDLYRQLGRNETTMLRDLVDYAAQVANGLLVPKGFSNDMWRDLGAAERFYVRMLDMEAKGSTKVADFQNFARSFAFGGYGELMASSTANAAALAGAADLKGRMLSGEGFGGTQLRQVLFAIWKTMETDQRDPKRGVLMLKTEYVDYWTRRQKLIALADYVAQKTQRTRPEESAAAAELAEALKLDRL